MLSSSAAVILGSTVTDPATVLRSWTIDPAVVVAVVAAGFVYLRAARRVRQRRGPAAFPRQRIAFFMSGLAVVYLALQSPIDTYADLLLSVHIAQHLLITMIGAPLLLLGTPIALALQAFTPSSRRRVLLPVLHSRPVRVLRSPLFGWAAFAVVIWGTHYSPVYEAALQSETVHALEHLAYLAAGLLFWWPVVGLDPSPARLSHPGRLLYLFVSMPVMALLGLAIFNSGHVLYPHYTVTSGLVGISALADQHLAGALMWEGGMFVVVPALGLVLWSWMNRDEREAARADARRASAGV